MSSVVDLQSTSNPSDDQLDTLAVSPEPASMQIPEPNEPAVITEPSPLGSFSRLPPELRHIFYRSLLQAAPRAVNVVYPPKMSDLERLCLRPLFSTSKAMQADILNSKSTMRYNWELGFTDTKLTTFQFQIDRVFRDYMEDVSLGKWPPIGYDSSLSRFPLDFLFEPFVDAGRRDRMVQTIRHLEVHFLRRDSTPYNCQCVVDLSVPPPSNRLVIEKLLSASCLQLETLDILLRWSPQPDPWVDRDMQCKHDRGRTVEEGFVALPTSYVLSKVQCPILMAGRVLKLRVLHRTVKNRFGREEAGMIEIMSNPLEGPLKV